MARHNVPRLLHLASKGECELYQDWSDDTPNVVGRDTLVTAHDGVMPRNNKKPRETPLALSSPAASSAFGGYHTADKSAGSSVSR